MATLYLSEQQSIVKKRDGYLIVQYPGADKRKVEVPLIKVSQVVVSVMGDSTTPAVHTLLEAGIEICYLSMYGHFRGNFLAGGEKCLVASSAIPGLCRSAARTKSGPGVCEGEIGEHAYAALALQPAVAG